MTMTIATTMKKKKTSLQLSHERIHDNNPDENPRIIQEGRTDVLHTYTVDDQWQFGIITTTNQMDRIKSKQGIELKGIKWYHQDKDHKR